jgi:hypothetical protein
MKTFPLLALLTLLLTSCGTIKPLAPNLAASQINAAPLPDSKIDVPISIDLTQVFNDFNSKIPSEFSGEGSTGPAQYRWRIQRQPFNMSFSGDSLHIIDAAHCNGGGYLKNPLNGKWSSVCSCDVDVTIGIHADFNLSSNYSLAGDASLTQFDLSACNLNMVNFNVSPILKPHAIDAINNALAALNEKLKQYNFRALMQPAWNVLYQPIKIDDIGYIVINPSAIRLSRTSGAGNMLNLSAGVTAKPVFYLNNPGKTEVTTLPDISTGQGGSGFNLNLDVHLDYQPLNNLLKNAVENQKLPVGANGYLLIKDAGIYGTGNNHLLIKVKFSGKQGLVPYHGILYFTCIPVYDINTGNFYINDIDFDVNTITKLKEGPAVWILGSGVKKYLNSQVHFNVAGQVNGIKDKLSQSLNRQIGPNLTLSGNVDSLSLQGILPENDYILVRLSTTGNLVVKVN